MAFKINDTVLVVALKKKGLVTGVSSSGRYKVAIGDMQIQCSEEDLRCSVEKAKKKRPLARKHSQPLQAENQTKSLVLDLHGYSVEQALKEAEQTLSNAVLAGCDRVEIIHGIGSGKIKAALHAALANLTVVKAFKLDPKNPGTTWVYF